MNITWAELSVLLPEMIVAGMASAILILDLYIREQRRGLVHFLSLVTLVFAAIATLRLHEDAASIEAVRVLEGTFVRDQMGDLLKLFVYLVMAA
ncbi:MAG: hypothetical protein R3200_13950, partial [Xanthomonadales bacterium]|nr:hypothetical protein [Xanthomonadales bacterium]